MTIPLCGAADGISLLEVVGKDGEVSLAGRAHTSSAHRLAVVALTDATLADASFSPAELSADAERHGSLTRLHGATVRILSAHGFVEIALNPPITQPETTWFVEGRSTPRRVDAGTDPDIERWCAEVS